MIHCGDSLTVLKTLPDESVHCCVTSPPYWGLRDYGVAGQLGLEKTPEEYVANLLGVFREVWRVLRKDGTLWLNLGDSYAGGGNYRGINSENALAPKQASNRGARGVCQQLGAGGKETGCKPKDLIGIPWLVAFALRADGWWLRQDIIWSKPNPMPESVTDRPTRSHEYIFLLSKSAGYYYDHKAIQEPGITNDLRRPYAPGQVDNRGNGHDRGGGEPRKTNKQRGHSRRHDGFNDRWDQMEREEQCNGLRNKRSVWTVSPAQYPEAHFATFPPALIKPCILAGCPIGGTVLDPFFGSGTTGMVATELARKYIGIELNSEYCELAKHRCNTTPGLPLKA